MKRAKQDKQEIIVAIRAFVEKRPGIYPMNYTDVLTYLREARQVTGDLREARVLINAVARHDGITANNIVDASKRALAGRLTIASSPDGPVVIDCAAGPYFLPEYRKAVCAVMASALWAYYGRTCATSADIRKARQRSQ